MKALTVHAPWSDYLIGCHKGYETRSWSTNYRGLVGIHTGQKWSDEESSAAERLHHQFKELPLIQNPTLGKVLGICRLVNCIQTERLRGQISAQERTLGGWADGRYAWEMEVIEVFPEPIFLKGQQGLFDWSIPAEYLQNRVAIIGSRDYEDLDAVRRYVYSLPLDTVIISGGARGVDETAEKAASERGMRTVIIPVNTRGLPEKESDRRYAFGQRAMARNSEIVELAGVVAAFWDGSSRGTKDGIDKATKAGKTLLINPDATPEAPKQLSLSGFVSTYDEGAYIELLVKKEKLVAGDKKVKEKPFQWEWPWRANDSHVWVKNKSEYKLVPIDSQEAISWSKILGGWVYSSETFYLKEWLKGQAKFIPVPGNYFDLNQYALDKIIHDDSLPLETVTISVDSLTLCQSHYNPAIALQYLEAGTVREFESNSLPMVFKFKDDNRYFVSNGTHRVIAWQHGLDPSRRSAMPVRLIRVPYSLDALEENALEMDDETEKIEFYADVLQEAFAILGMLHVEELVMA